MMFLCSVETHPVGFQHTPHSLNVALLPTLPFPTVSPLGKLCHSLCFPFSARLAHLRPLLAPFIHMPEDLLVPTHSWHYFCKAFFDTLYQVLYSGLVVVSLAK